GEPLANQALRALVTLDGEQLPPINLTTNADGGGLVRFKLPGQIERGDALLTVLVDDGGVTESVSKRVPIILKRLQFSLFPEGGALVAGVPGRVYFEAKNLIGKPADVEGRVVDDQGNTAAKFTSHRDGLGRFDFTPATGRTYHAEVTRPVGISEQYALPVAEEKGCVLRAFDDLDGLETALRVSVRCSEAREVVVLAVQNEQRLDAAAVAVPDGAPAIVYLQSGDAARDRAMGIARVTVLDPDLNPLAERLVFRNRRRGLQVAIAPDQADYVPREQVALKVTTTDADGQPVPAELALSVVDDTVISFADDKKGHMLSKLLLEPEIPGEVEEPNFYFDLKEEKSALAMDLLMGTRGWRRFDWQTVINPPPPMATATGFGGLGLRGVGRGGGGMARGKGIGFGARPRRMAPAGAEAADDFEGGLDALIEQPAKVAAMDNKKAEEKVAAARAMPVVPPMPKPAQPMRALENQDPEPAADMPARGPAPAMPMEMAEAEEEPPMAAFAANAREIAAGEAMGDDGIIADNDWAGARKQKAEVMAISPVRVFPAPTYPLEYDGPRTDFRETVFWAPAVRTGADGTATVTFNLSDAVTSFRVFAEGAGGGLVGRTEHVIGSKLPFSMSVKLPVEVSAGDTLELPLTLSNERDAKLPVSLSAAFGDLLALEKPVLLPSPQLDAKQRASLYYPVKVTGVQGKSKVMFSANAGGLKDEFVREVTVEPLGFPQMEQAAGTLADAAVHNFDLTPATPGTINASLKLYPSPVASMTGGLAGLIRQPSGCFEQTSSSNYPNVMVLSYLQANDAADPALLARTQKLIDQGYNRLVGYETKQKGYEWFGSTPAHEALTAYGVVQFLDMKRVYGGVDDAMIARTVEFLKKRRDGKGGFMRDGKALDSFGRASPEVTDAYITWAISQAGLAGDFGPEMAAQVKRAAETKDAYILALAANTLLALPDRAAEAASAVRRLAEMQSADGPWTTADHSITRSSGANLHIETTSLALLALMQAGGFDDQVRRGVDWLNKNRGGFGQWGATQATVLALKASTEYANRNRATQAPGRVTLVVNGAEVAVRDYPAGQREPIEFDDFGKHLKAGPNTVEIRHQGTSRLPYGLAVEYRAEQPATDPDVAVSVETALAADTVKMGENVRLTATVRNKTAEGQPMTLARVGLPGGLTFQNWQLKELVEKKQIAFFETGPREVILYFRELKPSEEKKIPLDLVAMVPGEYTGPASSAYLYYTDDLKHWAAGSHVRVVR
ncbi:MAG: hypothetical protein KC620_16720, partial [Myxococcales bacterium]|nr:hypothetical protein [Myxococcales bacterium]